MLKRAFVADLRGLPDDDAHSMIEEHPPPDGRARMNLDARQPASPMGEPASSPAPAPAPQPIGDGAVPDEGMQPRIASQHLPAAARRGIAFEHDGDVFAQPGEHDVIFAYPSVALKYWGTGRLAWHPLASTR